MEENGQLVQFIFNTEREVIAEKENEWTIYIRGSELLASSNEYAKTYYHYANDEMGSISHIVDDRKILNQYEYDTWGNVLSQKETINNHFKFNGQQLDPITQQYYLRARFYNPIIGRFTQEDTYRGDGLNLYSYCANNPIYYVDPSGNVCKPSSEILKDTRNIGESLQDRGKEIRKKISDFVSTYNQSEEYFSLSNSKRKKIDRKLQQLNKGNLAVANVSIPGMKSEFKADSQIHSLDSIGSDIEDFSYSPLPENRLFESYVDDVFPRYNDTEAKILEDIASQIKDPNIKGQIDLYSELICCQSCSNLIMEFRYKYKNIKLNVYVDDTINN